MMANFVSCFDVINLQTFHTLLKILEARLNDHFRDLVHVYNDVIRKSPIRWNSPANIMLNKTYKKFTNYLVMIVDVSQRAMSRGQSSWYTK